jgi:hypothetical protein
MSIAIASDPTMTLAANAYMLMSIWKPVLLFAPFVGWAWMISTVLDKHAQRFFLGQEKWNVIHMVFGIAALLLVVALPVSGVAGFAAAFVGSIIILGLDVLIFILITNKDTKVPHAQHERYV